MTWTDQELDAIQDAEHREAAWATDDLPQTGYRGPVRVVTQKSGPAFDTPVQTALTAAGDVLHALDRKCLPDLVDAWVRLSAVVGIHPIQLPATVGTWGKDPWKRLTDAVVLALCYTRTSQPSASTKWNHAASEISAWVRHCRDCYSKELDGHKDPSERDLVEDGPSDAARIAVLESEIYRYSVFLGAGR